MTLLYKPVQSNMASEDGEKKWYPHLVKLEHVKKTQDIAEEIAQMSSTSIGDVHSIIRNMMICMRRHLLNSHSVQLEGLGTFTVKAESGGNGVSTPEEVSPKQINYLKVQFTPSYKRLGGGIGKVCPMLEGAEFEKLEE